MNCPRLLALAGLSLLATQTACDQREIATCDITQRACQESVYYRVLNLRNDGYDPFGGLPPIGVITEDEFRAMLEREEAAAQSTGAPNPWDKALELLHFTASTPDGGSSSIDDQVTHIYAYYDPQTKAVTVISHPDQTSDHQAEEAMVTLAHELVHAVQDRELNLNREDFHTSDEYLAYNGIIEGDARFYENLFFEDMRRMLNLTPGDPLAMPDEELEYAYANFEQLGSPLFAARYLLYPLGAKYESTAYRSGGNAAVRHAYAKAPIRTVGLLVGPDGRSPPVGTGDVCAAPAATELPTDNANSGTDQFGALLFYTFLRGWGVDHATAFPTAQSWTGDYLRVQANAEVSTTAVAWRLEFSADLPAPLAPALRATGELSVSAGARSLEITTSDSATPLDFRSANCP
jgi:hypothetical protein